MWDEIARIEKQVAKIHAHMDELDTCAHYIKQGVQSVECEISELAKMLARFKAKYEDDNK